MKKTAAQLVFQRLAARGVEDPMITLAQHIKDQEERALQSMQDYRRKRSLYTAWSKKDFASRQTKQEDVQNIFNRSNQTMNVVGSHIKFSAAKTRDDLFGTEPYYAVLPENPADPQDTTLTDQIYQHSFFKLREAKYEPLFDSIIERCYELGETILRSGWREARDPFHRLAHVLAVPGSQAEESMPDEPAGEAETFAETMSEQPGEAAEGEQGQPAGDEVESQPTSGQWTAVLDSNGDFIEVPEDGPMPQLMQAIRLPDNTLVTLPPEQDAAAALAAAPKGSSLVNVLQSDPATVIPPQVQAVEWLIEENPVTYRGLDPTMIHFENWRCFGDFATVEASPLRGHFYECKLSDLIAKLEDFHGKSIEALMQDPEFAPVAAMLQSVTAETAKRKDPQAEESVGDDKNPVVKCFDCEVVWDPEGRGKVATFYVTMLWETHKIFFVEYLAGVNPMPGTAYTVIAIHRMKDRWYGRGEWELYSDVMMDTDRLWNNLLVRDDMAANPITGIHEDALDQDSDEVTLVPGARVKLKKDKKLSDFAEYLAMPNTDGGTWKMLDYMLKLNELETGSTSPARGELAGQPSNATATGTQAILVSGSILHKDPENEIRMGIEELLTKDIGFLYAMQDRAETVAYGSGQTAALATITPEQVRGLKLKIHLTMTRFHQRELMQSAQAAIQALMQYLAIPEGEKGNAKILFQQLLKGAGIQNADKVLRDPLPPSNEPPHTDPKEIISANFRDLPPDAKNAFLAQAGLPATATDEQAPQAQTPAA